MDTLGGMSGLANGLAPLLICVTVINAHAAEPPEFLAAVARELEALKTEFPQLSGFTGVDAREPLRLTHQFHTHRATKRGGWTAGVPNPDPDGIWFSIEVYERDSHAQRHSQPITEPWCLGSRRVQFLILEGEKTKPVAGRIRQILGAHGAKRCSE